MTQSPTERRRRELLLGEWACLGVLYEGRNHGFAVASMLRPGGELGRVWSLSRALTYRSLDQLAERGLVRDVGQEPGIAGGNRTVLATTRAGRSKLRDWLETPVEHLRDLRSELLLKLLIAERCDIDVTPMLQRQREIVVESARTIGGDAHSIPNAGAEVVELWRREASTAALRFLDQLLAPQG